VLDDVERRRFLVDPARKDPAPARIRLLDVHLDERTGQLLILPGRGGLASPQAHDDVVPAGRLTGLQADIANDTVALVKEAENRDAIGHRGHARLLAGPVIRALGRGAVRLLCALILLPAAAACGKQPECSAH
jgi:hypothetical protein